MPVPVTIDFTPPIDPDIAKLYVYEGATIDGPFVLIDSTLVVGAYPNYITRFTTALATSVNNWFCIEWENSLGVKSGKSAAVQGNTTTLVGEIVARALLRDPSLNENIVAQEAEAIVEMLYPKRIPRTVQAYESTLRRISGMTLLAMVRSQISILSASSDSPSSWTAGLVSMKSDGNSKQTLDNLRALALEAGRLLSWNTSRVAQMATPQIAGGLSQVVTADISRLLIEVE